MVKHEDMLASTTSRGINIKQTNTSNIEKIIFITFGIFTLLTIISLLILTRFNVSATGTTTDTSSATASVNVNAACTLSASGTDSHTTTLSGGQYDGNVGTTTVKSICNDSGGYALYAIGYSNHSYIPTELGSNTDLIWDSSTAGSTSNNIPTGIATSGNNSAWSMKLTATGTTNVPTIVSGNNYTVVPSTFTKVAYYPNSTMNPSDPSTHDDGSYLTTTYGIYVSPTQAPGTYNGKVKYTLVHPNDTTPPVAADCNPNGTTIGAGSGTDIKCMQDISSTNKSTLLSYMVTDKQYQLMDIRDHKTYWVAKLKDGNIWMTQNLDLNLETIPNQVLALTSENTDLTEYGINGYIDGYTCSNAETTTNCTADNEIILWTPERNTIDAATTETTSIASLPTYENDYNHPYSVDPGDWYWKGTWYPSSQCPSNADNGWVGCNFISKPDNNPWADYFSTNVDFATNNTHNHVGNYYNWSSAIASNNSSSYTTNTATSNTVANSPANSICPAGWRLPKIVTDTATGQNDFYNLHSLYNNASSDEKLISYPLYFARVGGVWKPMLNSAGYSAGYISSSVYSSTQSYALYFTGNSIDLKNVGSRQPGNTIRCLVH